MKIIAIEGIDGSGKALQMERLRRRMEAEGMRVSSLSFPQYGRFFGKEIGSYLKGQTLRADQVDSKSMCLWYALDRFEAMQNHRQLDCDVLLLNRYTLSNAVYQSVRTIDAGQADNWEWVQQLEHGQLGLPRPDVYIILDVDPDVAQRNVDCKGSREYIDGRDVYEAQHGLLQRARARYLSIAQKEASMQVVACCAADQMRTIEDIASDIWAALRP